MRAVPFKINLLLKLIFPKAKMNWQYIQFFFISSYPRLYCVILRTIHRRVTDVQSERMTPTASPIFTPRPHCFCLPTITALPAKKKKKRKNIYNTYEYKTRPRVRTHSIFPR
jgi:hypothetical protein